MQREPIQFGTVAAARAKRSAAGFSQPLHCRHKSLSNAQLASAFDAAFADYNRVDTAIKSASPQPKSPTQILIADIATQLEALDNQRRQLARLLESVDANDVVLR